MAWIVLIVSGVLEAGWAVALKLSDGFSRLWPTVTFAVLATASFAGLAWAMKQLPAGPAYAVWTGIGAAITAVIGMVWLGDGVSVLKIASIMLIIGGVVGLQLAGGAH
ncbi:multidrug efflux SMR transporter [Allokutzneria sp. NRRL B-24872]|uniref:DMT family transporter n=1 Tax=Allokutzneria sp. NRRL B-24872 TaxID=1137961 RepID=UPI000A3C990B|nr:multidrug efflux SMR transporter [Allokutzneria sp. NRRL B-24872]